MKALRTLTSVAVLVSALGTVAVANSSGKVDVSPNGTYSGSLGGKAYWGGSHSTVGTCEFSNHQDGSFGTYTPGSLKWSVTSAAKITVQASKVWKIWGTPIGANNDLSAATDGADIADSTGQLWEVNGDMVGTVTVDYNGSKRINTAFLNDRSGNQTSHDDVKTWNNGGDSNPVTNVRAIITHGGGGTQLGDTMSGSADFELRGHILLTQEVENKLRSNTQYYVPHEFTCLQ
jgi:hypothetical protein